MIRTVFALTLLAASALLAQDEIVDLTGWRMREGDDARWAAPDFDDSDWTAGAPLSIASSGVGFSGFAPVTWYRLTYRIQLPWRGHSLALGIWKLDDAYEVFAGGVKIGSFGTMPAPGTGDDRAVTAFAFRRLAFPIPLEVCRNGAVQLTIRRWRLPVMTAWESHEVAPFPGVPLPVIGLAGTVEREREILSTRTYFRGLPGILEWIVTLACGGLCLALRRRRESRELLWAGLALLSLGAYNAFSLALALAGWPKTSFVVFACLFAGNGASTLFFGWFLAELVPERRRVLRWLSVAVAVAVSAPFLTTYLWFPSWEIAIGLRRIGRLVQLALCLSSAWVVWRGRRPGLAVVVTLAVNAAVAVATNLWNSANYYRAGLFVISLRRTSDALIAVGIATLLYAHARRERERQQDRARDLEAARRVQETLLGGGQVTVEGFAVDEVYLPAREVGGDFYQTIPDTDGSLLVLVGDVSGKGLQAAMLVSSVLGSLRNERSRDPGEVLAHLNRSLLGRTSGGFVTCCCARFQPDGAVAIASAGHLSPYCDGRELDLPTGLPLGVVAGVDYEALEVGGERFTFVSDGVVEAENARRELFGFDRTREISGKSAQQIAEAAQAWGQTDDITVVTVRRVVP